LFPWAGEKVHSVSPVGKALTNWLTIIGLIYFSRAMWKPLFTHLPPSAAGLAAQAAAAGLPAGGQVYGGINPPAMIATIVGGLVTPSPTAQPTPAPTSTPQIDPTPVRPTLTVYYSYYYPPLGGANCHTANWVNGECADTTASGQKWTTWLNAGGAACPLSWPIFTRFEVLSPTLKAGVYTCVDYCPACGNSQAHYWIDFLTDSQELEWSYPMEIRLLSIGYIP
jgi:hypothetical protein